MNRNGEETILTTRLAKYSIAMYEIKRLTEALRRIAAYDPGVLRPLADEIAIWKLATDALKPTIPRLCPKCDRNWISGNEECDCEPNYIVGCATCGKPYVDGKPACGC